jgi:hypothetical protein
MDIIDSFNKLTLGKYAEIREITKDESLDEVDRIVAILSVLTGASEDDILHLPIADFTDLSAKAKFLSADGFQAGRIAKKYKVGEWELIPVTDYRRLETCQYIDFKTYAPDVDNRMVELLSVILVPKGHRYNEGYDILEVQRAIREEMSVTDGVSIAGFFLALCRTSIKDSLNFSKRMAEGIKDKAKREEILRRIAEQETALRTSGDG